MKKKNGYVSEYWNWRTMQHHHILPHVASYTEFFVNST